MTLHALTPIELAQKDSWWLDEGYRQLHLIDDPLLFTQINVIILTDTLIDINS